MRILILSRASNSSPEGLQGHEWPTVYDAMHHLCASIERHHDRYTEQTETQARAMSWWLTPSFRDHATLTLINGDPVMLPYPAPEDGPYEIDGQGFDSDPADPRNVWYLVDADELDRQEQFAGSWWTPSDMLCGRVPR